MSISQHSHTGQALVPTNTPQDRFGMEGMEEFYIAFKEKPVIYAEAQFDAESFKTAYPDIYHQIGTRDWSPFTLPVDPYLLEMVWEFYTSYRERQQLMKRRGSIEAGSCLTSVWVRGQEMPANGVIMLATKTKKEDPSMKRAKFTCKMTLPSSSSSTHTATTQLHTAEPQSSPPLDFLNIEQRAKMHENQGTLKKALQPAKDKLAILCSTVDVLECKVGTLKRDVVALTAPSSIAQPNPCEPKPVPEAPRSPPDNWWAGYDSESEQVLDEEPHYNALLHLRCVQYMMSILLGHLREWQQCRTMSFALYRIIGWCKAKYNLYLFHRIHNNQQPKRQLLSSLMLPPILGDYGPITNSIRKHLSLVCHFFGCIGGDICFQFGGGLILVHWMLKFLGG
ncbi:hypothetical protein HAX54_023182 [Datura stramonium]|uniref:Uncharacterized protein n=1 Tax=Datura stramonium TaxID=4076 RepID=A0ABS8UX07_DATST|nr:hypothetical protein [Datura stramonium]